jgi:hypothetical protein
MFWLSLLALVFHASYKSKLNLVSITKDESIEPTQNFDYIKNTISSTRAISVDTALPILTINGEEELDTIFPTVNISTIGNKGLLATWFMFQVKHMMLELR